MPNRAGHRRFGNVRKRESGRFQIRYPGLDGRMRTGPDTYERKSEAERALTLIEAAMMAGEWTDPERGKVKLGDYAATWIAQRPGLRVRTVDLYSWHLAKHIAPYLTIFNCGSYRRGARSSLGLARKPSRRPGWYCIRRSRVRTSAVS
jgi:hypothetical protein